MNFWLCSLFQWYLQNTLTSEVQVPHLQNGTRPPVLPSYRVVQGIKWDIVKWSFFINFILLYRPGQHDYDDHINVNLSLIIWEVTTQHMNYQTQNFFLLPSLTGDHFISTETNEAGKTPEAKTQKRSTWIFFFFFIIIRKVFGGREGNRENSKWRKLLEMTN